mmetsp:Transcript_29298/g.90583  ORF Transcript_29298/g.90583 Transcript_29298/m.90583 type:complete len:117 (+) Transcript_29298:89-439(+)
MRLRSPLRYGRCGDDGGGGPAALGLAAAGLRSLDATGEAASGSSRASTALRIVASRGYAHRCESSQKRDFQGVAPLVGVSPTCARVACSAVLPGKSSGAASAPANTALRIRYRVLA